MRRGIFGSKVKTLRALGIIALMASSALAQNPAPPREFEVASVNLVNPPMGPHAKEITAYTLSVAKNGPTLNAAKADEPVTAGRDGGGVIQLHNQPMIGFVNLLANILDLPVRDKTGLTGRYNFALDWNQDPTSPSLFTAVREQLGLDLKAQKNPVEVLMVDHAARPTEN
ncbi:MAG: TIGR03435 family protein [Bryobacteraceae bacterium]